MNEARRRHIHGPLVPMEGPSTWDGLVLFAIAVSVLACVLSAFPGLVA